MTDTPQARTPLHGKRLVVKVGSSLVTNDGEGLDQKAMASWVQQICELRQQGCEVLLVSSGAIAQGLKQLKWSKRPHELFRLQAAAAVGQMGLIQAYEQEFAQRGQVSAQVLLTHADLEDRGRYLNARSALFALLANNVVPIINENDTVVTDEIRFGDNDTLAALVVNLVEADGLIILTDQEGLFDKDPRSHQDANLIQQDLSSNPVLLKLAGSGGSSVGTGGMLTKVMAAQRAARSGACTWIASGRLQQVLVRLVQGEVLGTWLKSPTSRLAARKQWLADHLKLKGALILDEGAARAIRDRKTSLLPVGVTGCNGRFQRGEVVACLNPSGKEVARGLVNYSSAEVPKIKGQPSQAIEGILGYLDGRELIHRDNMVVF